MGEGKLAHNQRNVKKKNDKKPVRRKLGEYLRAAAFGAALVATPVVMNACKGKTEAPKEQTEKKPEVSPEEKEKTGELNKQLLDAIVKGETKKVKELLDEGAEANAEDEQGNTALWGALKASKLDIVKILIENEADVNAINPRGKIFLIEVVFAGYKELAELAIDNGAKVDAKGPNGKTALMKAIILGNESMVKLLIDKNADVNATDDTGDACIWKAWYVKETNINILKTLIKSGADMDVKSAGGVKKKVGFFATKKKQAGSVLLIEAVKEDLESIVKLMVENGVDANAKDGKGDTALIWSAWKGQMGITKILLNAKGIDVNAKDDKGETALTKVSKQNNNEMVELLEAHGATE